MLNTISKLKTINTLKVFIILALLTLTTISGCRASSETSEAGKNTANENQGTAEREKTDSSAAGNSNVASATNGNSSTNANNPNKSDEKSSTAETVVTHDGFGKIKVGMTVAQASQALGTELVAPNGKGECYYVEPKQGFKGVDFMVIEGKIARLDVANKEYATDKGAKIGDTEAKIKSLYKGVEVFPNKYDEKKHDMEVYSVDKKYLIIFETDGKIVTGFRVGKAKEAAYVERCG